MARRYGNYKPRRINQRVPNMAIVGMAVDNDIVVAEWSGPDGVLVASNATGILSAVDMTNAGSTGVFAATYKSTNSVMGRWGRGLVIAASGASTGTVTVTGQDYLGQPMVETATLSGTSSVALKKAFYYVTRIAWTATAATTLNVGWSNVLGLPYKFVSSIAETKNKAAAANAGTFVAGLANGTAATANNADVRGTYLPITVLPDGTNVFEVRYIMDNTNGHGNVQFAG